MLRDVILGQRAELEKAFNEVYVERDIEAFWGAHNLITAVMGPAGGKAFFVLHALK
jgi:hypothetical protein